MVSICTLTSIYTRWSAVVDRLISDGVDDNGLDAVEQVEQDLELGGSSYEMWLSSFIAFKHLSQGKG